MNELEDFLALPDITDMVAEVEVSERLGKFKIKPMTMDDFSEYQKRCTGKVNRNGVNFDSAKFNILVVKNQTVFPDFSNAEFLKKAKCNTPEEFITKKLLVGEITKLSEEITKLSGFDTDINKDIEDAKN